jgi:hypothetical protein
MSAADLRRRYQFPRLSRIWQLVARAFLSHTLAQANSSARMARPAGITTTAGPGNAIINMPTSTTVPPTTAIAQRRAHL